MSMKPGCKDLTFTLTASTNPGILINQNTNALTDGSLNIGTGTSNNTLIVNYQSAKTFWVVLNLRVDNQFGFFHKPDFVAVTLYCDETEYSIQPDALMPLLFQVPQTAGPVSVSVPNFIVD